MGADLYLRSAMDTAHSTYHQVHVLARQAYGLARGEAGGRLSELAERLFEDVRAWSAREGPPDTAIFDLSSQIRDLAQGETTVWLQDLSAQLLREVQGEGVDPLFPTLAQVVCDLAQGRSEEELYALIDILIEGLQQEAQAQEGNQEPWVREALEKAACVSDLARGNPASALREVASQLQEKLREGRASLEVACVSLSDLVAQMQELALESVELDMSGLVRALQRERATWEGRLARSFDDLSARSQGLLDLVTGRNPADAQPPQEDAAAWLAETRAQGEQFIQALADWQQAGGEGAEAMLGPLNGLFALFPVGGAAEQEPVTGPGSEQEQRDAGEDAHAPAEPRSAFPDLLQRYVAGINSWSMTAMPVMMYLVQGAQVLCELTRGETSDLFLFTTRDLVEHLRPPVPDDAQEGGASEEPVALAPDADVLDMLWHEVYRGAGRAADAEARKRRQEDEADPSTSPHFCLAVHLRDLAQGDASRLLGAVSARLLETVREKCGTPSGDAAGAGRVPAALLPLAEQVAALARGEPECRLRVLCGQLVEHLRQVADPGGSPLPLAEQVAALARGELLGPLRRLLQDLAEQVAPLEEDAGGRVVRLRASVGQAHDLLCGNDAGAQARALIERRLDALLQDGMPEGGEGEDGAQAAMDALIARARALFSGEATSEATERQRLGEVIALLLDALPQLIRARGGIAALHEALAPAGSTPREQAPERVLAQDAPAAPDAGRLSDRVLAGIAQALLHRSLVLLEELLLPPEGYFRDGYNDTCVLFWSTGKFWMTDIHDIAQDLGDEAWPDWWRHRQPPRALSVPQIRQLFQHIQQTDQRMPPRERLKRWPHLRVDDEGEHSLEAWHASLRERRQELLAFLDGALRREEPILCSL